MKFEVALLSFGLLAFTSGYITGGTVLGIVFLGAYELLIYIQILRATKTAEKERLSSED